MVEDSAGDSVEDQRRRRTRTLTVGLPGLSASFDIDAVDETPREEVAFRRHSWRKSNERQKLIKSIRFAVLIAIGICIGTALVVFVPWSGEPLSWSYPWIMPAVALVVLYAAFFYGVLRMRTLKQQLYDRIT